MKNILVKSHNKYLLKEFITGPFYGLKKVSLKEFIKRID